MRYCIATDCNNTVPSDMGSDYCGECILEDMGIAQPELVPPGGINGRPEHIEPEYRGGLCDRYDRWMDDKHDPGVDDDA